MLYQILMNFVIYWRNNFSGLWESEGKLLSKFILETESSSSDVFRMHFSCLMFKGKWCSMYNSTCQLLTSVVNLKKVIRKPRHTSICLFVPWGQDHGLLRTSMLVSLGFLINKVVSVYCHKLWWSYLHLGKAQAIYVHVALVCTTSRGIASDYADWNH